MTTPGVTAQVHDRFSSVPMKRKLTSESRDQVGLVRSELMKTYPEPTTADGRQASRSVTFNALDFSTFNALDFSLDHITVLSGTAEEYYGLMTSHPSNEDVSARWIYQPSSRVITAYLKGSGSRVLLYPNGHVAIASSHFKN